MRWASWSAFCVLACSSSPAKPGADGGAAPSCQVATPCNDLVATGSALMPTCSPTTAPALVGGTIAPGTYRLTAAMFYGDCTDLSQPPDGPTVFSFGASCADSADPQDGAENFSWSTSGNELTLTRVCPSAQTTAGAYSSSNGQLSLLVGSDPDLQLVAVFTAE